MRSRISFANRHRLFDVDAGQEPVKLLPGQVPHLVLVPRPPVPAPLYVQTLIQQNIAVPFPEQRLDAVAPAAAEQKQGMVPGIQMLGDLTAADKIDVGCSCKIA